MNIDFQAHMVTPVHFRMVLSVINRGLRMVSAHGLEITNNVLSLSITNGITLVLQKIEKVVKVMRLTMYALMNINRSKDQINTLSLCSEKISF